MLCSGYESKAELLSRYQVAAEYLCSINPRRYVFTSFSYLEGMFIHRQLWDTKESKALTPILVFNSLKGVYDDFIGKGD